MVGHVPSVLRSDLRLTQGNDRREGEFAGLSFFFFPFFSFFSSFFLFPFFFDRKTTHWEEIKSNQMNNDRRGQKDKKSNGGEKRKTIDPISLSNIGLPTVSEKCGGVTWAFRWERTVMLGQSCWDDEMGWGRSEAFLLG